MDLLDRDDEADDEASLPPPRPMNDDTHFDITAMIDLVFMMNIFFLVTSLATAMAEIDLPLARHAAAADAADAVVVIIVRGPTPDTVSVYLNDRSPPAITGAQEQETKVREAIEAGMKNGKKLVLIKAEGKVRYRDVSRLAQLASAAGAKLHVAVTEVK